MRRAGSRGGDPARSRSPLLAAADARAQERAPAPPPLPQDERSQAALVTRLAYVVTGDAQIDATSKAGLVGLTQVLASRTALEPGEPIGVDLARDELAFYPLLYWPIVAEPADAERGRDPPARRLHEGRRHRHLRHPRRHERAPRRRRRRRRAQYLRRMLATLDIPELEPVPRDHVLTKTFYLLDHFPGRYARARPGSRRCRRRRGASAARRAPATASRRSSSPRTTSPRPGRSGRRGEALYPIVGADPRQREIAFRGGVNIVMYALTGNYKADQVHVPALLERLGQ